MQAISNILIILSCFLLGACATPSSNSTNKTERFTTHILDDDSKLFEYVLISKVSDEDRKDHHNERRDSDNTKRNASEKNPKDTEEMRIKMEKEMHAEADKRLIIKLNETGFCRTGYITLNKRVQMSAATIHGECNDFATPEDREKFPNPPAKPIIEERLD